MNNLEIITLDNGLKIYFYLDKRKHSTYAGLVTKFGGHTKDFIMNNKEYHLCDGIAHLLEHYVVEANAIGNYIKILGKEHMHSNATTSSKKTYYYFKTAVNLEKGLDTLLRCCYFPVFNQENLDTVREPIYQEIRMINDDKFHTMYLEKCDSLFQNITYKDLAGTIKDIKNVDIETLKAVYEAFYQPKNQFLVIAGNFNKKKVLKTIKKVYDDIKFENHEVKIIDIKEPKEVKRKQHIVKANTAQDYASVTYKINISDFSNKEKLKLDFYIHYFLKMTFGITSKLYKTLVEKKIITYSLNFSDSLINNYMIVTIGCYSDDPKSLTKSIINELKKLNSFDKDYFELLRKESKMNISIRPEHIDSMIIPLVENIIEYDYPYFDTVEDINNFNYDEFVSYIKKLDFSNYTITYMKDKNDD